MLISHAASKFVAARVLRLAAKRAFCSSGRLASRTFIAGATAKTAASRGLNAHTILSNGTSSGHFYNI